MSKHLACPIIAPALTMLLVVACSLGPVGWPISKAAHKIPPISRNASSPERCLAISGGGIRSGAVSLGVLQGLYDHNELAHFQFISTVSGGGYPIYGVLNQLLYSHRTIDELLKRNSAFVSGVEARSRFIGIFDIYEIGALSALETVLATGQGRAFGSYKIKIASTFSAGSMFNIVSKNHPFTGDVPITATTAVLQLGFPTPIFVTSVNPDPRPPSRDHKYTLGDVFELSGDRIGSPSIGYFEPSDIGEWISTGNAIAMSAAAVDTPQGKLQLPAIAKAVDFGLSQHFRAPDETGATTAFTLEDGGFIDNLGLVPLLRRGCADILMFDNSDDDQPFSAWTSLRSRLDRNEEPNWRVTDAGLTSRIGKIKAPAFDPKEDVKESVSSFWKWQLPEHVWDAQLENGTQRAHVTYVKLGLDKTNLDRYPPEVRDFAHENWKKAREPSCQGNGLHRKCSFPLEATARQTFSPEEFNAYRELGFWLATSATPSSNHAPSIDSGSH